MVDKYFLSKGSHDRAADGRCAMEWVSYLAGEPHTDRPVCVSPVLARFCIALNDRLDDEQRQKLRPYLARTIGTAGDGRDEERLRLCREWLIGTALPEWCEFAGWDDLAERLRSMPDALVAENVARTLRDVRAEAWARRRKAMSELRAGAVAAAGAGAGADAAAAADAGAGAGAGAGADAVAVAAAVAVAGADAAADAGADAAAVAAAAAVAVAVADYEAAYQAIYTKVKLIIMERTAAIRARHAAMAFDLLDRMLPMELVQLPVVEDAALVCGVPVLR
jgi:hypothetical protein